ncbi:MAG TPA: glycosyltransferase family 4 protein [Nitrospira sp.]|nr:glycosyltransferase family 4 protein [Nitrospira sp.]
MADPLANVRLALFLTRRMSLRAWDEIGLLDREAAPYRRLERMLRGVMFVTYGDRQDLAYAARLGGMRVHCNRWRASPQLYERYLTKVMPWSWRGPVVVKSNQVQGAEIALAAARRRGKPFIARCGYLPSDNMERSHGADSPETKRAQALERHVFSAADRVVVTTTTMRETVIRRYQLRADGVRVIPNYVDTSLFAPSGDESRRPNQLLYVGRLDEEKNPGALLAAIEGMDVELVMVGKGSQGEALHREASERRLRVRFLGNVPNQELPRLLNSSAALVMPSLIEGHPKALLEAMACAVPVIGTNVPGIHELLIDRVTGLLCEPSPESLRTAIKDVLNHRQLGARLGAAARSYVADRFSLERVVDMELALLDELAMEIRTPQLLASGAEPTALVRPQGSRRLLS